MPTPGIRVKNRLIKTTPIETVVKLYKKAGLEIRPGSKLTARAAVVTVTVVFHNKDGKPCCRYPASIKIMDECIALRWVAISSRQYYHIGAYHKDELNALEALINKTWTDFETAASEKEE